MGKITDLTVLTPSSLVDTDLVPIVDVSDTTQSVDGTTKQVAVSAFVRAGNETVTSVAGDTGDVVLVKGDVGLGNVDNTSDANKPISTATQSALDLKATIADTASVNGSPSTIDYLWCGTQAQYDAIGTKDAETLYFIQ